MFQNTTIPILEQVVRFTEARHGVLAGNIANIDTPGYRTADLSPDKFEQRLREAIDARDARHAVSPGNEPQHDPVTKLDDSLAGILRHDDSNVSLEQQVAEMSKNQAQHNLALTILTNQYRLLQTAISERIA